MKPVSSSSCSRCGYINKKSHVTRHINSKTIYKPILNNDPPILITINTTVCDICDTEISNTNYSRHRNMCELTHTINNNSAPVTVNNIPGNHNNIENNITNNNYNLVLNITNTNDPSIAHIKPEDMLECILDYTHCFKKLYYDEEAPINHSISISNKKKDIARIVDKGKYEGVTIDRALFKADTGVMFSQNKMIATLPESERAAAEERCTKSYNYIHDPKNKRIVKDKLVGIAIENNSMVQETKNLQDIQDIQKQ